MPRLRYVSSGKRASGGEGDLKQLAFHRAISSPGLGIAGDWGAFRPRMEKRPDPNDCPVPQGRRFEIVSNFVRSAGVSGRLTSASLTASSFWSIATYCPCQQGGAPG